MSLRNAMTPDARDQLLTKLRHEARIAAQDAITRIEGRLIDIQYDGKLSRVQRYEALERLHDQSSIGERRLLLHVMMLRLSGLTSLQEVRG